ncbi:SctD family type III secretion system inner membrane ring subunit PscD [Pseudomonas aeruginosa]|uniref:SctD family type III secretion system inner membrane ring subunit PscD n=2 Tax=Pseudomonas aeruginosa TaxID=287 RepID=UPI000D97079F|nr:SctD family type III secretion system inner membrane ring subunit PscD [Pseudomonas aeruginosa]PXZ79990.1 EscD/YscD/HrpQ family type III secretion system inner membrane ring protein [Pseudomonas aeruginosa]HEJ6353881.1 SctD family type III secretion system inner membrane ring subunit PscD [Pseudomonas aeruginosa]
MAWKIRFYSGLNQGAEVSLGEGRVALGSDPLQADLVLLDEGIAAVHLVLEVDAQGVRLLEWAEGCEPRQDGQAQVAGAILQALAGQTCGPLRWAFCDPQRSFPERFPEAEVQTAPVRRKSSARAGGVWLLGVSLALALCLLGMLVEPWSARQHGMAGEEPLAKVRAYLREQGMSEVDVQRYLDGSGVDYRLEARSMEDIRQGVDFILQKFGYRQILSSNADKPGWVRLNGELAEQDERWARIDALLESEVPGLLGVENQVRVAGSHLRRLERLLADAGLDRQLSFRERGERIELSGTLDEVQLSAFYRLQREFQQEFGNRPSLELLSRGKRASGDELEFTVRSVSLGRVPYVVLGDGQKYPVGASTSRGVRILAIEPESILVARGKQRFIINLKGEVLHDDSLGNATVGR